MMFGGGVSLGKRRLREDVVETQNSTWCKEVSLPLTILEREVIQWN